MSTNPVKRKLAAILAADAVGYSRLMAANEEGTMKILAVHRAVIDGIIEFHEGRIVGTAGDSVLAEFGSAVEAVRCAVEMQDALKTRNDSLPENQRMQFRIGVNLGDVMAKGNDLLGDGVNIAARLESIAEPGGICVSSSIYDQIAGKLDLGFVDIGTQSLKNIQRPIQVYRIERTGRRAPEPTAHSRPRRTGVAWIAGSLASALVAAGLVWYFDLLPDYRRAERERAEAEIVRKRVEEEAAKRQAADEARRAREGQRAAENRARQEAERARARAETEATRRQAAAEAAAAERRRAAQSAARPAAVPKQPPPAGAASASAAFAPAPVPPRPTQQASVAADSRGYRGPWSAEISCRAFGGRPAFSSPVEVSVTDDRFNVTRGVPGSPDSFLLSGVPEADGRLQLNGDGLLAGGGRRKAAPQPYKAAFDGRFNGGRYEAAGQLGAQACALTISRAR